MQVASLAAMTSSPRGEVSSSFKRILRLAANVEHPLGVFREDLSRGGERNTAAKAFKQLGFQFVFELADLRADGRLRAITGLRGLREALQADDFEKRVELVKIHTLTALVTGREDGSRPVRDDFSPVFYQNRISRTGIGSRAATIE